MTFQLSSRCIMTTICTVEAFKLQRARVLLPGVSDVSVRAQLMGAGVRITGKGGRSSILLHVDGPCSIGCAESL